jgi:hypothetical protein
METLQTKIMNSVKPDDAESAIKAIKRARESKSLHPLQLGAIEASISRGVYSPKEIALFEQKLASLR